MSYNIVKKGDSTVIVQKYRENGKVREKYIGSLGVLDEIQFKNIRSRVHELPQEKRVDYCLHNNLIVEVDESIPRRKSGSFTPEEVVKEKKARAKRTKKPKITPVAERKIWETRPWLKKGSLKYTVTPAKVTKADTLRMTGSEWDTRIQQIRSDIKLSEAAIAQKRGAQIFTKTQQESNKNDIEYHQSVIKAGKEAIRRIKNR